MLTLRDELFLGEGTKRKCYAHPDDPTLCIKITSERGLRSVNREIRYLNMLRRRGKPLTQIADFIGKIQTNIGDGEVYQLVRDFDGQVSRSLRHYLSTEDDVLIARMVAAIVELREYLFQSSILFSDLTVDNLLVRNERDGGVKLIVVDGVGDNNQIQILEYFKYFGEKHCRKKWNSFVLKTVDEFPKLVNKLQVLP